MGMIDDSIIQCTETRVHNPHPWGSKVLPNGDMDPTEIKHCPGVAEYTDPKAFRRQDSYGLGPMPRKRCPRTDPHVKHVWESEGQDYECVGTGVVPLEMVPYGTPGEVCVTTDLHNPHYWVRKGETLHCPGVISSTALVGTCGVQFARAKCTLDKGHEGRHVPSQRPHEATYDEPELGPREKARRELAYQQAVDMTNGELSDRALQCAILAENFGWVEGAKPGVRDARQDEGNKLIGLGNLYMSVLVSRMEMAQLADLNAARESRPDVEQRTERRIRDTLNAGIQEAMTSGFSGVAELVEHLYRQISTAGLPPVEEAYSSPEDERELQDKVSIALVEAFSVRDESGYAARLEDIGNRLIHYVRTGESVPGVTNLRPSDLSRGMPIIIDRDKDEEATEDMTRDIEESDLDPGPDFD